MKTQVRNETLKFNFSFENLDFIAPYNGEKKINGKNKPNFTSNQNKPGVIVVATETEYGKKVIDITYSSNSMYHEVYKYLIEGHRIFIPCPRVDLLFAFLPIKKNKVKKFCESVKKSYNEFRLRKPQDNFFELVKDRFLEDNFVFPFESLKFVDPYIIKEDGSKIKTLRHYKGRAGIYWIRRRKDSHCPWEEMYIGQSRVLVDRAYSHFVKNTEDRFGRRRVTYVGTLDEFEYKITFIEVPWYDGERKKSLVELVSIMDKLEKKMVQIVNPVDNVQYKIDVENVESNNDVHDRETWSEIDDLLPEDITKGDVPF
jgi:hypothetical protein